MKTFYPHVFWTPLRSSRKIRKLALGGFSVLDDNRTGLAWNPDEDSGTVEEGMQSMPKSQFGSAVPPPAKPDELRKLVLKLRWIGMESEADILCDHLARTAPADCVLVAPCDTD